MFEATHELIVSWIRDGLVDGLRVDHPDGLADPGRYLDDLAEATGGAYVLVEKILESGEVLPPFWATAGTTGYDALADLDRVLVDPAGQRALDRLDASLRRGGPLAWADLIHDTKRAIADGILNSEVRAPRTGCSPTHATDGSDRTRSPSCSPASPSTAATSRTAPSTSTPPSPTATRRRPDLADAIADVAASLGDPAHPAAIRFQQTSGMVMAKGVEDTAFYRVSRLASLTEVGADPDEFALTVERVPRPAAVAARDATRRA